MIEAKSLCKTYGAIKAVNDLSFTVEDGQVLGFLGPNGAGKSTTMKMLTGFLTPTSGTALIDGIDVVENSVAAREKIGYLPEGAPSYGEMTVRQFLTFVARARLIDKNDVTSSVTGAIEKLDLLEVKHQVIDTLSKGFKRRVGLAQAIIHDPKILILDEPTDGLDPNQKREVRGLIRGMAKDKIIIISTHILEEVQAVCNRVMIIAHGKLLADDTPQGLITRSRYHNAVSLVVEAAEKVASALSELPEVARAELNEGELTLFPAADGDLFGAVTAAISENDWHVSSLRLEAGRLDEVFRTITRGECVNMNATINVMRRELGGYFATPVAYVFLIIFLVMTGIFSFYLGNFYERGYADLDPFFRFHPWLYLFLVPAISMRLWAEERRLGTIELLFTLPLTTFQAVMGKFLAAWLFIGLALLLTLPMWITVNYLGSPDNGVILAAYIGSWLMAGGFLSIGSCMSALTRNQVVAFILSIVVCFLFLLSGLPMVMNLFNGWAPQIILDGIASLSFLKHFADISKGVIDLRDLVYFVLMIGFWLLANVLILDMKKAD